MQAVIRTGAKQYIVEPNQKLEIDLVGSDATTLEFEPLLVIDGDKVTVGTPVVPGVKVTAKVLGEVKGDKIRVLKFKPKKRIKKQTGHRQRYTQIQITGIAAAKAASAAPKPKAAATKSAA